MLYSEPSAAPLVDLEQIVLAGSDVLGYLTGVVASPMLVIVWAIVISAAVAIFGNEKHSRRAFEILKLLRRIRIPPSSS